MTTVEIIIVLIVMVVVFAFGLTAYLVESAKTVGTPAASEPTRPRVTPPADRGVYTFSLDSQLKAEEWQMLFNSGWSFVTCNTEQYKSYAGGGPGDPGFTRTRWHYVFRRTGGQNK